MNKDRTRRKRKLGSYPFFSVIFSITLSLLVVGLFGVLLIYAKSLTKVIQDNVEVQVYLNKEIGNNDVLRIQKIIETKPYLRQGDDLENIRYISKDEAAEQFIADTGEDFVQFLGDNPLRDLLIVKVNPDYQSLDSLQMIKGEMQRMSGVFEVDYAESLVESINRNLQKIGAVLVGFMLILLIAVVVLINNTIKIALYSQRFLIRSMQLVGATKRFIRSPFLRRSMWYGIASGLLASGLLYGLIQYTYLQISDLSQLQNNQHLLILTGVLVVLGMLVAYLSTLSAMNRYLKISLDELY